MTYVMRDMTHPEGGIFSAEDADSLEGSSSAEVTDGHKKKEGAYYVWTKAEIEKVILFLIMTIIIENSFNFYLFYTDFRRGCGGVFISLWSSGKWKRRSKW